MICLNFCHSYHSYIIIIVLISFAIIIIIVMQGDHDTYEDQDDFSSLCPTECAGQFFAYVVDLKISGSINATQACILSYWASRAGDALGTGDVAALGMEPGKGS